jgi:hypothetical protein
MGVVIDLTEVFARTANAVNGARRNTALGDFREKTGVQHTPELDRIMMIPRRTGEDPDPLPLTNYLKTSSGTMVLKPVQAKALHEAYDYRGLFGPIRVSGGKTLISLLVPVVLGARAPVLLVPASLVEKTKRAARILAQHWQLPTFIRIRSYQALGRVSHADQLEKDAPDLIIADEAHRLKNPKAAVTKRVARYMKNNPDTIFVALTGSISKRSLKDFAHIMSWCLKNRTLLPCTYSELEAWCLAIDEKPNALTAPLHPGALLKLCDGSETGDETTRARQGLRKRITDTPGVVAAGTDGQYAGSLIITGHVVQTTHATEEAFKQLRTMWETPDGHPVSDGFSVWRHARELALGFYYKWDPRPPQEWIEARKAWCSFVRSVLKDNRRQLDSELQVAQACANHPEWYGDAEYQEWLAIKGTFKPRTVAVPFDNSVAIWAAEWCDKGSGLVWCEHVDFAQRFSALTGIPYFAGKGESADGQNIETYQGKHAILSIRANLEGRNLQDRWSRNAVVSPPQSGADWQQLLARTHRDQQEADEVTCDIPVTCFEHLAALEIAMNDARYQESITGETQKLQLADLTMPDGLEQRGYAWTK